MARVRWLPSPGIRLDEGVKREIEEWVGRMDLGEVRRLGEYEETGEARILPVPDPAEGLYVKVVMHRGRPTIVAGLWEHGGYAEEYYVGEVVEDARERAGNEDEGV